MNILETIIAHKKKEVAERKKQTSTDALEKGRFFSYPTRSLKQSLIDPSRTGIIAEYKRRSPSKGVINNRDSVESVTRMYSAYGASGISVLTDLEFFGGSLDDLLAARDNGIPLLRKDFMIDEYQIVEAKAFGAGVPLWVAARLRASEVKERSGSAQQPVLEQRR